jgi:uncharacterized membrane protein
MDEVAPLRALHVIGAVLLLGNVVVTGVWAALLYGARPGVPFRAVARAILWTDLVFTGGGGALLTISGVLLAMRLRLDVWQTPWLLKGISALGLATLVWLVVLLPWQFRMERLAPDDVAARRRVLLRWSVVGWIDTGVLFYGLWSMVTKR